MEFGDVLSKALEAGEAAEALGVCRRNVAAYLESLDGVVRTGRRYRIPLKHLSPEFLIAVGLLKPIEVPTENLVKSCETLQGRN